MVATTKKLDTILSIKALRKRKAEFALQQASKASKQLGARAFALRELHQEKQEAAQTYASRRFMQMRTNDTAEVFFSTMTLGLLRHRKDAAATGVRLSRADHDYQSARAALKEAMQAYSRSCSTEEVVEKKREEACLKIANQEELTAEEDVSELMVAAKFSRA